MSTHGQNKIVRKRKASYRTIKFMIILLKYKVKRMLIKSYVLSGCPKLYVNTLKVIWK